MASVNPLIPSDGEDWYERKPAWWRAIYGAHNRLTPLFTSVHPRATFRLLGRLGRLANRFSLEGPSPEELAALFGGVPRPALIRIAREVAARHFRNRAVIALVHRSGVQRLAPLVRCPSAERLRELSVQKEAALLVTWHVGAIFGIGAALHRHGIPALILRNLPLNSADARTLALQRALDHLRGGGLVVAFLDGPGGVSTGAVECLGRRVVFRRGPFMLARVTGAPLIPIIADWEHRDRIAVRVDAPLQWPTCAPETGAPFEDALAAHAARWLEAYLRAAPQEIWLYTLRNFLRAPVIAGSAAVGPGAA